MTNHFINKLLNPFINEERFEEDGKIMNLASCDKLLQSFGAKMFIDSRAKEIYPDNHGTTVRIHFKSAA